MLYGINGQTKVPFLQVGGSMGLWLGLGVVQALQVLVESLSPVFRVFK